MREWQELITENGLIVERTPKGNKEANGGAESSGKRIVRVSRAMMIESGLPRTLWPHFVDAAAFILNRTPVKRLQWKTPYEIVFGRQPNLAGLRIPGSLAYVRRHDLLGQIPSKNNLKVENNAVIGYYIGPVGSNIYNIWIPSLERVVRTRDAIIDEQKKFNPAEVVPKESPYAPSGVTLLQVEVTEPVEVPVRAQKPESSKAQDSFNPYPTPVSSMDSTPILTPRTGTPALSEACEQLEAEECEQPETIGLEGQVERQSAPVLPTVEEPEPLAVMKPKRTYSKKPTDEQVLSNLRTATRRTRGEAPEL